jgi:glycine reductase
MLLAKLEGRSFETELPMPVFDIVPPAPPVAGLPQALIAIGTEGGIVPKGNPDRIEAHNASKWCVYSLQGLENLNSGDFEVAHGGYDPVPANADPDRVLPLDGMRRIEKRGDFRKLLEKYFVTVGNVTAVKSAERYGREIAAMLHEAGVDGVVMSST